MVPRVHRHHDRGRRCRGGVTGAGMSSAPQETAGAPGRGGYQMALVHLDPDGPPVRVKVVMHGRRRGMIARWTDACSGCTPSYEERGGGPPLGGGCFECGHTGRRRQAMWVPLPPEAKAGRSGARLPRLEGTS